MTTHVFTAPQRPPTTPEPDPAPGAIERAIRSIRDLASLSEILRLAGAASLVVSMAIFLLQGWHDGNDIDRYLKLLAQTGLLAAAGLAVGQLLGEARGARVLFGLALVSVPVNMTVLAALIYSQVQWDGALGQYPAFATWQVVDPIAFGIVAPVAIAALVAVTSFSFAVLARAQWRQLAWPFLAMNAALLLPVRDSIVAGALALATAAWAAWHLRRLYRANTTLHTTEGRFAMLSFTIAPAIMLMRSGYFYEIDSLMSAALALAGFAALRQTRRVPERSPGAAIMLELAMAPVAFLAALALGNLAERVLPDALPAVVFSAAFAALAADMYRGTQSRRLAAVLSFSAVLLLGLSAMIVLLVDTSVSMTLLAVVIASAMIAWGMREGRPSATTLGALTLVGGLLIGSESLLELAIRGGWLTLAIAGGTAIVAASLVDRFGPGLLHRRGSS
jgi:hypothetical protein